MQRQGFIMPLVIIILILISATVVQSYKNIIATHDFIFDRIVYTRQYYLTEAMCNAGIAYVKANFNALLKKAHEQSLVYKTALPNTEQMGTCIITKESNATIKVVAKLGDLCSIETRVHRNKLANKKAQFVTSGWKQDVG
ncbi:hypothetical protein A3F06_02560 [candidate division TM6 bacterium RIFCSPHIGHO2_12_FULL_36_22]|nr:MAG: hypothetical protein A3F06_02560 [candidate division TM6 bacterium RIFCSPHIGHO2_12_FULL_36_22]